MDTQPSEEKLATPELKVSTEEAVPEVVAAAAETDANLAGELHQLLHKARPVTCSVRWEEMEGESCVRKCLRCGLDIFDLSNGSQQDAERFVAQSQSRSTIKLWRRSDGRYVRGECLSTPMDVIPSIVSVMAAIWQVMPLLFSWKYTPITGLMLPLWAAVAMGSDILSYLAVHPMYGWLILADLAWISFGYMAMSKHSGGWSRLSYILGFYVTGSLALAQPSMEKDLWLLMETLPRQGGAYNSELGPVPTMANFPGFDSHQGLWIEFYLAIILIGLFFLGVNALASKLSKARH